MRKLTRSLGLLSLCGIVLVTYSNVSVAQSSTKKNTPRIPKTQLPPTVTPAPPVITPLPGFNVPLPLTFDTNINPVDPTQPNALSEDAQAIVNAHNVARQQVQAALAYLVSNRRQILAGENDFYNEIFGGFYDPNNQFRGQYSRELIVPITIDDPNATPRNNVPTPQIVVGYTTEINTAHFDHVLSTFQAISNSLDLPASYRYGAQFDSGFLTYAQSSSTIGDSNFGSPASASGFNRGTLQWGLSNSNSQAHQTQIQSNPSSPLLWYLDNAVVYVIDPVTGLPARDPITNQLIVDQDESYRFFNEKLDIYARAVGTTSLQVMVGNSFFTGVQRSGDLQDGTANTSFTRNDLQQYQQIIAAFATTAGASFGVTEVFGQTNKFFEVSDASSYAKFADLSVGISQGGVGNGAGLPPLGKNGQFQGDFLPVQFFPVIP